MIPRVAFVLALPLALFATQVAQADLVPVPNGGFGWVSTMSQVGEETPWNTPEFEYGYAEDYLSPNAPIEASSNLNWYVATSADGKIEYTPQAGGFNLKGWAVAGGRDDHGGNGYAYSNCESGGYVEFNVTEATEVHLTGALRKFLSSDAGWGTNSTQAVHLLKRDGTGWNWNTPVWSSQTIGSFDQTIILSPGTYLLSAGLFSEQAIDSPGGDAYPSVNTQFDVTVNGQSLAPQESWRYTNFGTVANTGTAADAADFDGDGVTNLMEYAIGTDPKVISAGHAALPVVVLKQSAPPSDGPPASLEPPPGVRRLEMSLALPNPVPASLTYTVEVSSDLINWSNLASKTGDGAWTWLAGGISRISTAGSSVSIGDSVPADSAHPSRAMRLRVSTP